MCKDPAGPRTLVQRANGGADRRRLSPRASSPPTALDAVAKRRYRRYSEVQQMSDPWRMAGTEGTGEYVVVVRTHLGRIGYRVLRLSRWVRENPARALRWIRLFRRRNAN